MSIQKMKISRYNWLVTLLFIISKKADKTFPHDFLHVFQKLLHGAFKQFSLT